ncbi:AAC(3) family N-acetyltransferase [Klebsiella pneumoniae]|uniref:AAC(3) family N-acetyltransferase n=1 Tax=Klebsiella pneumoniae TaxID=573 RepID=UPI00388E8480
MVQAPARGANAHPDASMVALRPLAETLTEPTNSVTPWGKDRPSSGSSPWRERLLLLGAPLNSVTALHYAEAVADIPNKRWVTYEMPMLGRDGEVAGNGIGLRFKRHSRLLCYRGKPDAVENYSKCVKLGRHREGVVGFAPVLPVRRAGHRDVRRHLSWISGTTPIVPPHEAVERSCGAG